jgi:heme oxygenase
MAVSRPICVGVACSSTAAVSGSASIVTWLPEGADEDRAHSRGRSRRAAGRELRRADALAADLDVLHGPRWRDELAPGPAIQRYAARLDAIARAEPALLASHAYVRYLGDLSGGQLLRRVIAATLAIDGEAGLAFYRFTDDPAALAARLRNGLDAMAPATHLTARLVNEARWAFRCHIDLFEELAAAVGPADAAPLR